ncbi:MAG: site-2 protease family protein [Vulcanimicrobiota bacterium]
MRPLPDSPAGPRPFEFGLVEEVVAPAPDWRGVLVWLSLPGLATAVLFGWPQLGFVVELWLVGWVLLASLVAHELGHALMAWQEGDDTALAAGRLSLSPRAHFDPVGSLLAPVVTGLTTWLLGSGMVVAWARRIPVDPARLRSKGGLVRVALAGPLVNLGLLYFSAVMMIGWMSGRGIADPATAVLPIDWLSHPIVASSLPLDFVVLTVLRWSILVNAFLVAVNLFPVAPFDGAVILRSSFSGRVRAWVERIQSWALGLLPVLLVSGQARMLLWPVFWLWYAAMVAVGHGAGVPLPEVGR